MVLNNFVASLNESSTSLIRLVVADNLNDDDDVAGITEAFGGQHLPLERNFGYGGGMNRAVDALPAEIEWVLVTNPDVVLHPGSIDDLVATGRQDPRIGTVGPAILTDGLVYPSARTVPSLRTGIGHALFANIWINNPWTKSYRRDTSREPVSRDAGWLSGACVLVRRSAFVELGGFDEGYFMYFEDVDLGYRMTKAGYRNVYEPAAVVTHTGAHSTRTRSAEMIEIHHQSARRFLTRKYSAPLLWPIRVSLVVGLKLRSAVLTRRATHH